MNSIVQRDLERIYNGLTAEERAGFTGSTVLLTGGAGFLGFYFLRFFSRFQRELGVRRVIAWTISRWDARRGSGPSAAGGTWSCRGPRACCDEAKRFGETMCCLFRQRHRMPITTARPMFADVLERTDKPVVDCRYMLERSAGYADDR